MQPPKQPRMALEIAPATLGPSWPRARIRLPGSSEAAVCPVPVCGYGYADNHGPSGRLREADPGPLGPRRSRGLLAAYEFASLGIAGRPRPTLVPLMLA
jgi:hypothetical protein